MDKTKISLELNFANFANADFLRISRELNFANFAIFLQISQISSREILFPRKFKLAKIKTLKVSDEAEGRIGYF